VLDTFSLPREIFAAFEPQWKRWETLEDRDLDLCFIPHTLPYEAWKNEKGILAYKRPPTRTGGSISMNLAEKIIAYAMKHTFNSSQLLDSPVFVLYLDCPDWLRDSFEVLKTWIQQLLSHQVPDIARQTAAQIIQNNRHSTLWYGADTLSECSREILEEVFFSIILHLQGPLIIGLDLNDLGPLNRGNLEAKTVRETFNEQINSLILKCAHCRDDTYIVINDSADVKPPSPSKGPIVPIHQLQWNTEWKGQSIYFHNYK
jgi:hypothetical protein